VHSSWLTNTRHTFRLPMPCMLDNFVGSEGSCSGHFFVGEETNVIHALRACLSAVNVENDILGISQGKVATFFRCGGQVQKTLM